ncbi:GNAT family N-acetyltransferase [Chryseobacterium sp. Alg-005]|uniref:GNAT family N-acetyltransferase n=1 Tax=Chryseobacterium sp. Alg-005 TaxID=3159516 RepID=UPI0035559DEE
MEKFTFQPLNSDSGIPYALLLLADETVQAINKYIFNCKIYVLKDKDKDIAVMALHKNNEKELEIKNIAVIESYRKQGIGSILINKAKEMATQNHYASLLIGTSDTGFQQIRFYEKNGFIQQEIRKNFFTENYPFPIYENGKQMRDMIVLVHHLSE